MGMTCWSALLLICVVLFMTLLVEDTVAWRVVGRGRKVLLPLTSKRTVFMRQMMQLHDGNNLSEMQAPSATDSSDVEQVSPQQLRRDEIAELLDPSEVVTESEQSDLTSIEEDITNTVEDLLKLEKQGMLPKLDPNYLLERSAVLCNGRKYERVYADVVKICPGEDIPALERVNAFLSGFISTERKSRSRTKVNYILAGARSGQLEEALQMLSDSEELDDDVLLFIRSLKESEQRRRKGLASSVASDSSLLSVIADSDGQVDSPILSVNDTVQREQDAFLDEQLRISARDTLEAQESGAYLVLDLVEKRIRAELYSQGNKAQLRLLSKLLDLSDATDRQSLLREEITRIQSVPEFRSLVTQAISFLQEQYQRGRILSLNDEDSGTVVERMKTLLQDIDEFAQSMARGFADDGEIYSSTRNGDKSSPA